MSEAHPVTAGHSDHKTKHVAASALHAEVSPAKKRLLLVDDEPSVLNVMRAMSLRIDRELEVVTANNGIKALELMKAQPFDIIVSDMRMPEMSGAELLHKVMELYPGTARVIMSGYADQENTLQSLGATHQYLLKPCDFALYRSTISRILVLNRFLQSERLRKVAAGIKTLPSLPAIYFRLMKELVSPHATTESIGAIISQDISLTAKMLQLVNSAFFASARSVSSAHEAVQILGIRTVKTLALSIYVFSCFDQERLADFPPDRLWNHCMATGLRARKIMSSIGADMAVEDAAFTAGVLHDIGKLVLAISFPVLFVQAQQEAEAHRIPNYRRERELIGACHAEIGAYVLGLWGLPTSIVEAVAWHHRPQESGLPEFSALSAVHIANYLEHRRISDSSHATLHALDREYIYAINAEKQLEQWSAGHA